jgi:hypothetical protein
VERYEREENDFAEYDESVDDDGPYFEDDMCGDHASALASAGFGTDEDYGGACEDQFLDAEMELRISGLSGYESDPDLF